MKLFLTQRDEWCLQLHTGKILMILCSGFRNVHSDRFHIYLNSAGKRKSCVKSVVNVTFGVSIWCFYEYTSNFEMKFLKKQEIYIIASSSRLCLHVSFHYFFHKWNIFLNPPHGSHAAQWVFQWKLLSAENDRCTAVVGSATTQGNPRPALWLW